MALDLQEVFGLYRPVHAGKGMQLAPLMNPNNLGGFVAAGAPIWLGILQGARDPRDRAIAVIAVVLIALTVLLSLSRGAIAMLFGCIALSAFAAVARSQRAHRERDSQLWSRRLALGSSLSIAVALGAYLAADRLLVEFKHGGAAKLELIGAALRFAVQHAWLGVGRGAFGSTFVGSHGSSVYYRYAENFVAQWARI
jgi:hypothetical protein